jgi:hypothetical protein
MVEFALGLVVAMIVLFLGIQLAVIGRDAMALGQFSYQAARWAAAPTNGQQDCSGLVSYINSDDVAPEAIQLLMNSGGGITCSGSSGASGAVTVSMTCSNGDCTQRAAGDNIQISMTANIEHDLFLGTSFLGISFPTTVSAQTSALTQ